MIDAALRHARARRPLLLEMLRFATVGGLSAVVYAATIAACVFWLDLDIALSTIPGYIASMALNYTLQKLWTFKSDARHAIAVPKYLFVHAVGIAINFATVQTLMSLAGARYLPAQVLAVALVAAWSYLAQKFWTFPVKPPAAD
jgi:putative flippase GtrA